MTKPERNYSSLDKEPVKTASITVVIVTFNSRDVIGDCLAALKRCQQVKSIILSDNASDDDTVEFVRSSYPEVEILAHRENLGFGRGNNAGLERVDTEFGFVLNPDVIVNADAVDRLIETARRHPDAAIIGPLLRHPRRGTKGLVRTGTPWKPNKIRIPANTELEVDFLVGAALFLRMSHVRESGFFDPNIFLFYEDDDICQAARRAGRKLILTSRAVIDHRVGQSTPPAPEITGLKQAHFTWSRLYLESKEHGAAAARRLARQQQRSLRRKLILARWTGSRAKLHSVTARLLGATAFLNGSTLSTSPSTYRHISPTEFSHRSHRGNLHGNSHLKHDGE